MIKSIRHDRHCKLIFIIPFIFVGFASCREYPVHLDSPEKELFFYSEQEGLYSKGIPLLIYNNSIHQRAFNKRRKQYRFQTDMQDIYMNISLETIPQNAGTYLNTNLDFRSPEHAISNSITMECSKIQKNKYWFWDSGTKTGVILILE